MASVIATVDIRAPLSDILAVVADMSGYPGWSSVHRRATVQETLPDGRPKRVKMAVAAVGLTDEQELDYTWTDTGVSWSLVHPTTQQRHQTGSYSITPGQAGTSHVRYELTIDPLIPLPGVIVRQIMKKAVAAATDGLKAEVERSGAARA